MSQPQERLNERMRALLEAVRSGIPQETADLADEMITANESPIALDMVSEVLAERGAALSSELVDEFDALAADIGLGPETAGRLRR
jgi:hypothetical protein